MHYMHKHLSIDPLWLCTAVYSGKQGSGFYISFQYVLLKGDITEFL